jgi:hypothetical protein
MPQLAPALRVLVCGRAQTPSIDAVLALFPRETGAAAIARGLKSWLYSWSRLNSATAAPNGSQTGGIAQLGERLHGMQEVSGSIPLTSTTIAGGVQVESFE